MLLRAFRAAGADRFITGTSLVLEDKNLVVTFVIRQCGAGRATGKQPEDDGFTVHVLSELRSISFLQERSRLRSVAGHGHLGLE